MLPPDFDLSSPDLPFSAAMDRAIATTSTKAA
jgi:hypothetical protein